jgi:hypothetical protein
VAALRKSRRKAEGGGASRSGGAGDKILEGLQQKLTAVEDKVQELQQQLLARLVGGGGFDAAEGEGDDEVGDEEAVAALNDRVAKLLRMRSQIMQVFFFNYSVLLLSNFFFPLCTDTPIFFCRAPPHALANNARILHQSFFFLAWQSSSNTVTRKEHTPAGA